MLVHEQDARSASVRSIDVKDLPLRILGDEQRVVLLPFGTAETPQVESVFDYVAGLDDDEVEAGLERVYAGFECRHRDFRDRIIEHYQASANVVGRQLDGAKRRELAGAYMTMEYAFQAAALFNPSIVPHPDQGGVPEGALRFIMSMRAVGEGHVSSVVFHTGTVDAAGTIRMDQPDHRVLRSRSAPDRHYLKTLFRRKLGEMGVNLNNADRILKKLPDSFTLSQLEEAIGRTTKSPSAASRLNTTVQSVMWLARSNYGLRLPEDGSVNQLLLFPNSDSESRGIEDLRLVRFHDDGARYYGTYTAFDGERILPMLFETDDFHSIAVHTLNGQCAQNKGMALFPKRIDGHFAMCSRIDGRSLYLMYSDYVHFWESGRLLARPKYSWEYRIIGNCGSPLETPEGWLLITHGVGPMRQYSISAMLLDLEDPFKIRGRLKEPLIRPTEEERSGYVPNVVYSCGSLIWNDRLVLPYAISDKKTAVASVGMDGLIDQLIADGP